MKCGKIILTVMIILLLSGISIAQMPQDGLVALWKFDEGSGLTAHDYVNGHDASIHNATWVQLESGQALRFDGSTSYVDIPYSSELDINAQSGITVSAWIKLDAFPQNSHYHSAIFGLYASDGAKNYLAINNADAMGNEVMWDQYGPAGGALLSITPEVDQWYHVVAVQDATSRALYINGVLSVSDNSPEIYTGSQPNTIRIGAGASLWSDYFFNGTIDEVAIYNRTLSAQEITSLYEYQGDEGELVSFWAFDNDATDSVGGNDGILYGDASIIDDPSRGGCLSLDGNGDYVSCGDIDEIDLAPNQDISLACWFKFSPSSNFGMILDKRQSIGGNWTGLGIWKKDNNTICSRLYLGDSWSSAISVASNTIVDSEWHHLAVVCDRDGVMAMYLDGQLYDSIDISVSSSLDLDTDIDFTIGKVSDDASGYSPFDGSIDEVAIYSRTLSAQEIMSLYEYQGDEGELVSSWAFDDDATDSVGDNDGTLCGDALIVDDSLRGGCLGLDGDGDYVDCGFGSDLRATTNTTVTVWFKSNDISGDHVLASKSNNDMRDRYILRVLDGQLQCYKESDNTEISILGGNVYADRWHFATMTMGSAGFRLFLDGIHVASDADTNVLEDGTHKPLYIGMKFAFEHFPETRYFNGNIDEVAIYSRALSAQEILDIYEAGLVEPSQSKTYHVDCATGDNDSNGLSRDEAFETIQYAIDEANDFDTILVWPGVYNEAATNGINFKGKAVTVKSAADAAVLEVPGGYAVSFVQGEGNRSVLSNFVIKNSQTAVFALYSSPTITNLTVVDNQNGILADNAEPDISNCIFWNNTNGDLFGTPEQLEARYSYMSDTVEIDPVSIWMFDDNANDSVGNNDGVVYGAQWVTGKVNNALEFDGLDDCVEVADDDSLDITNAVTICAWIKTTETIATQTIISKSPGAAPNYSIEIPRQAIGGGVRFFGYESGNPKGITAYGGTPVTDGNWHHITATFDGTNWIIYDNAEVYKTRTQSANLTTSTQNLFIGKREHEDRLFNGIIDEVQIYGEVLSIEQIQDIYEKGVVDHPASPLFVDADNGDYHLLSERGRYRATTDEWILDDVTSPCVDGGDPAVVVVNERMPNGGRMNMGAYGNTSSASMSEWPLRSDYDYNGIVNFEDFAILANDWLETLNFEPNPEIDNEPPTPNPSQWLVEPYHSSGYHAMSAVQAFDAQNGPVWYKFYVVGGYGVDSGWQLSNEYRYYNMGTVAAYRVITCDSIAGTDPPMPNTANSTEPSEARVASE